MCVGGGGQPKVIWYLGLVNKEIVISLSFLLSVCLSAFCIQPTIILECRPYLSVMISLYDMCLPIIYNFLSVH